MVDAVRIIDLWQVILQEPRVANQEATMLLQAEIEQHMVRTELDKKHRVDETRVTETLKAHGKNVASLDKDQRKSRFQARIVQKKKKRRARAQKNVAGSRVSFDHVDTFA